MKRLILTWTIMLSSLLAIAGQMDSYNMRRGMEALNQGDQEKALQYFYQETQDNPKNGYATFYVAYLCHMDGNSNVGAFRFAKKAYDLLPKNEKQLKAVCLLIEKKIYEKAEDSVNIASVSEQIKRLSPDMATAEVEQDYTMKDLSRLLTSIAQNSGKANIDAICKLADSTNYQIIIDSLEARMQADEQNFYWPLLACQIMNDQKKHREAFEYAKRSQAVYPLPGLYADMGLMALNHFSNAELAEECLKKSLQIDSTDASGYISIANLYLETGRYKDALAAAGKAIELDASESGAYYMRGVVYRTTHEYQKAADEFLKAMLANPKKLPHLFRMVEVYQLDGDSAQATYWITEGKRLKEALGLEMGDDDYMRCGENEKALELCHEKENKELSDNEEYNLACTLAQLGETEDALRHLSQAVDKGFINLYHMAWDDDLDSLRNLPAFEEILTRCKEKVETLKDITL